MISFRCRLKGEYRAPSYSKSVMVPIPYLFFSRPIIIFFTFDSHFYTEEIDICTREAMAVIIADDFYSSQAIIFIGDVFFCAA